MLAGTLEWHIAILLGFVAAAFYRPVGWGAGAMLAVSLGVAALQGWQAALPRKYSGLRAKITVATLSYLQPLVRSFHRHRARMFFFRVCTDEAPPIQDRAGTLGLWGAHTASYWSEEGKDRTELLDQVVHYFAERNWGKTFHTPWSAADLQISCHPWTVLSVTTVQEAHARGARLIRARYRLGPTNFTKLVTFVGFLGAAAMGHFSYVVASVSAIALAAVLMRSWRRGRTLAIQAIAVFDGLARRQGLIACDDRSPALARVFPSAAGSSQMEVA
jgi:hypothetical protein